MWLLPVGHTLDPFWEKMPCHQQYLPSDYCTPGTRRCFTHTGISDPHHCPSSPGGRGLIRLGWAVFQEAACRRTPQSPVLQAAWSPVWRTRVLDLIPTSCPEAANMDAAPCGRVFTLVFSGPGSETTGLSGKCPPPIPFMFANPAELLHWRGKLREHRDWPLHQSGLP